MWGQTVTRSLAASGSALAAVLRQRLDAAPGPATALERRLRERLTVLRANAETDPFGNPLLLAALELSRLIDQDRAPPEVLEALVQRMAVRTFADRADQLSSYLGEIDPAAQDAAVAQLVRSLAGDPVIPFEAFRAKVELASFGIVLTAHPTFGLSLEQTRVLMAITTGLDPAGHKLDTGAAEAALREAIEAPKGPPAELTLTREHVWSIEVLGYLHQALDRATAVTLDVAAELYPERWAELAPRLATVASWVGYDLDGRSDIAWTDTMAKRLLVKHRQLERHHAEAARLAGAEPAVTSALAPVVDGLAAALVAVGRQMAAIDQADEASGSLATTFLTTRDAGLVDTIALREAVGQAIEAASAPAVKRDLVVLRAALASHGLGLAHTHVRLNATQLHNAIRKQVGMESTPDDPSRRRRYMNQINELIARAQPETVNFATLASEKATAKRLFMIVQQLVKYIDAETPVRFLIAETEAGFTLLTAFYFARLFGVEDRIEISPLFETAAAIERGDAIVEEALKSPDYRDYVRRLGRLAIQFGFSDSGRYLNQMAATFMLERLRLRLVPLLIRYGLGDVQLVLFNTHGESIGRGGHPASLTDRMRYVSPPVTRAAFAGAGIPLKEEVSFQGGDGFQCLMGMPSALAALRAGMEATLLPPEEAADDPVYAAGDFSVEFFATIRQSFESLVEDPHYAALLGVFGNNLAPRTGSRPLKRQHEGAARAMDLAHPAQLRAIPNNTILQQMGLMANTLYGLGRARARDPEQFELLMRESPRFRRAMAMAEAALGFSDLDVLRAYIDTLDPGMWLSRSGRSRRPSRAGELRQVAAQLERLDLHPALIKLHHRFQADFLLLTGGAEDEPAGLTPAVAPARRDTLLVIHILRLALIHRLYLTAIHVPEFSPHHGLAHDDMVARLLRLDVPGAVAGLKEIFPAAPPAPVPPEALAEPATYRGEAGQGYAREHSGLFDPMLVLHRQILALGSALGLEIGAVG